MSKAETCASKSNTTAATNKPLTAAEAWKKTQKTREYRIEEAIHQIIEQEYGTKLAVSKGAISDRHRRSLSKRGYRFKDQKLSAQKQPSEWILWGPEAEDPVE